MARWRLTQPHYLNTVPPTKYRYEEHDRDTGDLNSQEYEVPRHLDPNAPRDCRSAGLCVVSDGKGAERGDWIYTGEPTPDMEPLDTAAEEISNAHRHKWSAPMSEEAFPAQGGFAGALQASFAKDLAEAMSKISKTPVSAGVDPDAFKALQEQVASLMARNAELEAKPEAPKTRRA